MKIVYFGTPQFAAHVLQYLLDNGIQIAAVITKPDKPQGRSLHFQPTPVKNRRFSTESPSPRLPARTRVRSSFCPYARTI